MALLAGSLAAGLADRLWVNAIRHSAPAVPDTLHAYSLTAGRGASQVTLYVPGYVVAVHTVLLVLCVGLLAGLIMPHRHKPG